MGLSGAAMDSVSQPLACCMSAAQRSTPAPASTLMASQAAAARKPAVAGLHATAATTALVPSELIRAFHCLQSMPRLSLLVRQVWCAPCMRHTLPPRAHLHQLQELDDHLAGGADKHLAAHGMTGTQVLSAWARAKFDAARMGSAGCGCSITAAIGRAQS